ncbi:hypothetical protein BH10PSE17_BH10PSE17_37860 [soil metagenome]
MTEFTSAKYSLPTGRALWRSRFAATFSQVLLAVILGTLFGFGMASSSPAMLELDMRSTATSDVQAFFDADGQGFTERNSATAKLVAGSSWTTVRLVVPSSHLEKIRLDPTVTDAPVEIRAARLISRGADHVSALKLDALVPMNQVQSYRNTGESWTVTPTPGAVDTNFLLTLDETEGNLEDDRRWVKVLKAVVICQVVIGLLAMALRTAFTRRALQRARAHPGKAVLVMALAGTIFSCWPVVFSGKSFVAPGNGVPGGGIVLLYDTQPTLPEQGSSTAEDVHLTDVGAIMWHHFPFSVVQERSIKEDGEFPLWNRYGSAGQSMIGQGQAMLGDPLNWLIWAWGANSPSYDAKFLILRMVFAASLGFTVLMLTRSPFASCLVAFVTPFVGYFVFRVNHPAIFSLCYASVVLVAWIAMATSRPRQLPWWLVLVVFANWLMLNSGTVKEAYISAAVANLIGFLYAFRGALAREELKRTYLFAALIVLPLSALLGVVVYAPMFDAIAEGWTAYAAPAVHQLSPLEIPGFIDNFYFLVSQGKYWPSVNALVFAGAAFAILILWSNPQRVLQDRFAASVLAVTLLLCIAIACGVIPGALLIDVPFINSIYHVHNTFLTAAIVPCCVLAGIGFDAMHRLRTGDRLVYCAAVLLIVLAMVAEHVIYAPGQLPHVAKAGAAYGFALVVALAVVFMWIARPDLTKRTALGLGVLIVALVALLGRGADWGKVRFEPYVFNPEKRANMLAHSTVIDAARKQYSDPERVVSVGNSVFSGYRAVYRLEGIDGPEAIQELPYRQLMTAMNMPYAWIWRMDFTDESLAERRGALNFLGVGIVFARQPLKPAVDLKEFAQEPLLIGYRRTGAWPRAFFSSRLGSYGDLAQLSQAIDSNQGPFVDVAAQVVQDDAALRALTSQPASIVAAKDYALTANRTSFSVDAPGPGVIYLGEADEPGNFEVKLNGAATPYFTANGAFKGVYVPTAGTYRVEFRYWPRQLDLYLTISLIGLVLLAAAVAGIRRTVARTVARPVGASAV